MNIYLEKVKEFMLTFGQPVLDKPTELPDDRQELRIALIFEELAEYSKASGKIEFFAKLCDNHYVEIHNNPNPDIQLVEVIDEIEQFDALLDLQYVLSGAVHEHGFGEIFDEGFNEVHSSNMSKADDNAYESDQTYHKYKKLGELTYVKEVGNKFVTYRENDNKVLKSHKYKPAQLAQFLK